MRRIELRVADRMFAHVSDLEAISIDAMALSSSRMQFDVRFPLLTATEGSRESVFRAEYSRHDVLQSPWLNLPNTEGATSI